MDADARRHGGRVEPHPEDRPIDGVDASAFMLGKSETTGRDSYMFFGNDGELMSVKWKIFKAIFRYTEDGPRPAMESAYIKPQWPMMYDLSSDPHEDNNLFYTDLDNGWLFGPFPEDHRTIRTKHPRNIRT